MAGAMLDDRRHQENLMARLSRSLFIVLIALARLAAACGDDEEAATTTTTTSATAWGLSWAAV